MVLDLGQYYIIHLFFEPLVALLYFFYFYFSLGINILWGFAIMILVILLQLPLASWLNKLRTRLLPLTDSRLKLLHHAFSGIRTLKAQAWEETVRSKIDKARNQEVTNQIGLNSLKLSSYSILKHSSSLAVVIVLYSAHKEPPRSDTAFTLLAAFGFLSLYFGIYTGYAITTFAELKASFSRTSSLLALPEK